MKRILRSAAAEAIRAHLWQPTAPGPLGGRPWTMGRELEIFDRLCKDHDPVELLGAIEYVRDITHTQGPARLTWFLHPERGHALLSRCLAWTRQYQDNRAHVPGPYSDTSRPRGRGFTRISVESPPPNRRDISREIYDAMKDRAE